MNEKFFVDAMAIKFFFLKTLWSFSCLNEGEGHGCYMLPSMILHLSNLLSLEAEGEVKVCIWITW